MKLKDLMEFGQVVRSDGEGDVQALAYDDPINISGPESAYEDLDSDGQSTGEPSMAGYERHGWSLLTGFTGQYGYRGATMHPSEFIGGRLEDHIRENAGYYVAVTVDGLGATEDEDAEGPIGWAVAFKEAE